MLAIPEVARISLKRILFPTDFSPASNAALPFALALARSYGSTLLVTHIIPPRLRQEANSDRPPAPDDRVWWDARHRLDEWTRNSPISDTPCTQLLERGDLATVIPEMIREHTVDLVVLGTHGRRGVSKMVLGSDAEKIYLSASCPVLTVGPKVHAGDWRLDRILCPVDVVENPQPFLHYALSLAEKNQGQFIVLQAVPLVPWQHRAAVEAQMCDHLEKMIPKSAKDWCTPQFLVRWEHPAEAVLLAAAEREVDLIVMGVRKARAAAFSSHLPWPVASEVVSRAPCPVLTVRV